ncbi:hypothetical protein HI914_05351 [Erysiphe necator]|nr:hypothetical protein HI914_05351 [Erysiphe necator]
MSIRNYTPRCLALIVGITKRVVSRDLVYSLFNTTNKGMSVELTRTKESGHTGVLISRLYNEDGAKGSQFSDLTIIIQTLAYGC